MHTRWQLKVTWKPRFQRNRNHGPFERKFDRAEAQTKAVPGETELVREGKAGLSSLKLIPCIFIRHRPLDNLNSKFVNACPTANSFKMLTEINKSNSEPLREQRGDYVSNGFRKCSWIVFNRTEL